MRNILTVAAIVPTFNGLSRGFLHSALESIINQTHPLDEVILVDDGSTDKTADYVSEYFPEIKIIRKANEGLPAARNAGVSAASSDLITFLDDDDVWYTNKTKIQLDLFLSKKISREITIVIAPFKSLVSSPDKSSWILDKLREPCEPWLTWPGCILGNGVTSPSGVMLPRRLILEAGGFDSSLFIGEDYEFWMRLCTLGAVFYSCRDPLVQYRVHSTQASGNMGRVLPAVLPIHKRYIQLLPTKYQTRVASAILGGHLQIALRNRLWSTILKLYLASKEAGWVKSSSFYGWIAFFSIVDMIRGLFTTLGCHGTTTTIRSSVVTLCFRGYKDLPKDIERLRPNFITKGQESLGE